MPAGPFQTCAAALSLRRTRRPTLRRCCSTTCSTPSRCARSCTGGTAWRSPTSPTTRVACEPARCSSASPERPSDGHDHAAAAVAAGAVALVVERALDVDVPQVVVADARSAMAPLADRFFGEPTAHAARRGVTGTNGKTTTAYVTRGDPRGGRRPAAACSAPIEQRVGGVAEPVERTTPEAIDLQRTFRRMLDAGDRAVRDGGLLARARPAPRRRRPVRRRGVHQPLAGPPRLPRRRWRSTSRPRRGCSTAAARRATNADDPYGRRLDGDDPATAPTTVADVRAEDLAPRGRRRRLPPASTPAGAVRDVADPAARARSTSPTRSRPRRAALLAGVRARGGRRRRSRRVPGVPGRLEPVEAGQPFAVLVDYAHTPDALATVLRAARDLTARPPDRRVRLRRRPRPRQAAADGRRRRARSPTAWSSRPTTRAREDPDAIIAEILAGIAPAACWSSPTAAARSQRRCAGARRGRRRRHRRQGPRAGPGARRASKMPFDDRAGRAGGARA